MRRTPLVVCNAKGGASATKEANLRLSSSIVCPLPKRFEPQLMEAMHAAWHHEVSKAREEPLLRFLSHDVAARPLSSDEPSMVRPNPTPVSIPGDALARNTFLDVGDETNAEGSPAKCDAETQAVRAAVDAHGLRVRIPGRPVACLNQAAPNHLRRDVHREFISNVNGSTVRGELLRPLN